MRFQVSLPTPQASGYLYVSGPARETYFGVYERALNSALANNVKAIPAADLSIQWDVCQEVLAFERVGIATQHGHPTLSRDLDQPPKQRRFPDPSLTLDDRTSRGPAPHQFEPNAVAPVPGLIAVTKPGLELVVL